MTELQFEPKKPDDSPTLNYCYDALLGGVQLPLSTGTITSTSQQVHRLLLQRCQILNTFRFVGHTVFVSTTEGRKVC